MKLFFSRTAMTLLGITSYLLCWQWLVKSEAFIIGGLIHSIFQTLHRPLFIDCQIISSQLKINGIWDFWMVTLRADFVPGSCTLDLTGIIISTFPFVVLAFNSIRLHMLRQWLSRLVIGCLILLAFHFLYTLGALYWFILLKELSPSFFSYFTGVISLSIPIMVWIVLFGWEHVEKLPLNRGER